MKIGLCWHQKSSGSMWTYNFTGHIVVDLKIVIALATMKVMVGTNLHESHPIVDKSLHDTIKQL
jgi:hypothetical protein